MNKKSVWFIGSSRSGKTTRLLESLREIIPVKTSKRVVTQHSSRILIFSANDEGRQDLSIRGVSLLNGYPINVKTPLGFMQNEIELFWPLLIQQQIGLTVSFPLRLRPETEQELAAQLWDEQLDRLKYETSVPKYRLVRRILDLLQLAAFSGTPIERIPDILSQGLANSYSDPALFPIFGQLLKVWWDWCLERGFLTYGITGMLYWSQLLGLPFYQQSLKKRYNFILADDVDDYPAIARDLFEFLLDQGFGGVFTFNENGGVREGLNADPNYMMGLMSRCEVIELSGFVEPNLSPILEQPIIESLTSPFGIEELPSQIQSISTVDRGSLLRKVAEFIADQINQGNVLPSDIAIIGPGLDVIARYSLIEIFKKRGIQVESLNEQRPLINSSLVRGLLTLLCLVYPNLGRLIQLDDVAEMLVVLSMKHDITNPEAMNPLIDPVRAGLIVDNCFRFDPDLPTFLEVSEFPRWDRLGAIATKCYSEIRQWIEQQRQQMESNLSLSGLPFILDRAIQQFFLKDNCLNAMSLVALRELMETGQHFWEVDTRIRQLDKSERPIHTTIAQFILMLRRGGVTGNPYPIRSFGLSNQSVTLATIFQYRSFRTSHKWHFWLDATSNFWSTPGANMLYGAMLFLKDWDGSAKTVADLDQLNRDKLLKTIRDLLARVKERIYLCYSDWSTSGSEQTGILLSLINGIKS